MDVVLSTLRPTAWLVMMLCYRIASGELNTDALVLAAATAYSVDFPDFTPGALWISEGAIELALGDTVENAALGVLAFPAFEAAVLSA